MNSISFFAIGNPIPQPRPRAFAKRFGSTWTARVYNPSCGEAWKNCIAASAQQHIPKKPILGPVCLDPTFYFKRPNDHYRTGKFSDQLKPDAPKWHTIRGDRDNLDKAVMDALTVLGFFRDDGQVCDGVIKKLYCPPGFQPGCQVVLIALEEPMENESQREMFHAREVQTA